MTSPLAVAAFRGVLGAVVVGGLAFFTSLSQGQDLRTAGVVTGVVFFGQLVVRFGAEGLIDQVSQPPAPAPSPQTAVTAASTPPPLPGSPHVGG